MTSPPVMPPVQPEFHPEFGYLWPAVHTRRMVRIGLLSTAFGAMVGAIASIAMTHRGDPDAVRAQSALATEAPSTVGTAPPTTAVPMPAATPSVAAGNAAAPIVSAGTAAAPAAGSSQQMPSVTAVQSQEPPPATAATSCREQTWPYLDGKCLKNTARKKHQVRVLKPETPTQSAPAETAPAATTPATTAAVKPQDSSKAAKKRENKSVQRRERRRDREFVDTERGHDIERDRDIDRHRYVDPRNAYASPYEPRYEVRGGWGW